MENFRILCTGNPAHVGIANSVTEMFPNVDCISLSTGYDLASKEGQEKFRLIIKNYNVFINISRLPNNSQEKLLRIAHEAGMTGHVFNIGSVSEYSKWEWCDINYTIEKRQLREASLELCSEDFKTTHIVVGGFQDYSDTSPTRLDPKEIVKIIKYILESPVNIPIIGIEKINKIEMEKELHG